MCHFLLPFIQIECGNLLSHRHHCLVLPNNKQEKEERLCKENPTCAAKFMAEVSWNSLTVESFTRTEDQQRKVYDSWS